MNTRSRGPLTICATEQDTDVGIGQSCIYKQLVGNSDFNEGLIIREGDVMEIFFMTQSKLKWQLMQYK